jgi:hypothetical protein
LDSLLACQAPRGDKARFANGIPPTEKIYLGKTIWKMNWDFFIGYWIGVAVSATIFAALRSADNHRHDDDDDDYHYEYFDDNHIKPV